MKKVLVTGGKLLVVGNPADFHVGAHFRRAAESLGWPVVFSDVRVAYGTGRLVRSLFFHCFGRRPVRLGAFSRLVRQVAREEGCTHLLATGLAPLRAAELADIRSARVRLFNFLTDDPWNPAHHAHWFMAGLKLYDCVFSPRRQNLAELRSFGCRRVDYLPFAYCPEVHFRHPQSPGAAEGETDVLFAGGADADRVPELRALHHAGLRLALYGAYWERDAVLRPFAKGIADLGTLRQVTPAAKLVLCLVRRANRDGHAMRSFEAPAMGGCLLMEDTSEHRELFGADGECAVYFRDLPEMVAKAKDLLPRVEERARLAAAAHRRICAGGHTYADRLRTMLAE